MNNLYFSFMFKKIFRLFILGLVISAFYGCATSKKEESGLVPETFNVPKISIFSEKNIFLNIEFYQKIISPDSSSEKFEIKLVERIKNEDMERGLILEDARLSLKTNDQLGFFENQIKRMVDKSSGCLTGDRDSADLILNVALTYGPLPAPAYRDYNFGKSMGISILTLGLGPRSWSAVVDYKIDLSVGEKSGEPTVIYSNIVKNNSEQMKSAFNSDRFTEVQNLAIAMFGVSLESELTAFAQKSILNNN